MKIFRETVGKPFCSVINKGGINSAKERRGMAERRVHETQQRLHNAANTQLSNMRSALNEQRTKQSLVASWTKRIKDVEVHLNNVLGSSIVLLS